MEHVLSLYFFFFFNKSFCTNLQRHAKLPLVKDPFDSFNYVYWHASGNSLSVKSRYKAFWQFRIWILYTTHWYLSPLTHSDRFLENNEVSVLRRTHQEEEVPQSPLDKDKMSFPFKLCPGVFQPVITCVLPQFTNTITCDNFANGQV